MKRNRFSEEQITQILAEYRSGLTQLELSRKHGVSTATISSWNRRYGSLQTGEIRKVRGLEEENNRLKRIIGQQVLELEAAKDVIRRFS